MDARLHVMPTEVGIHDLPSCSRRSRGFCYAGVGMAEESIIRSPRIMPPSQLRHGSTTRSPPASYNDMSRDAAMNPREAAIAAMNLG
jgi:hypothetical protein